MGLRHQLPVYSPLPWQAVRAALRRGDPRPTLAATLRSEHGVGEVLLLESGTHALTLALLAAARRRPGLPCALPAYGCYDLASAAVGAGVQVVLYDLNPATLAPDPRSLEEALEGGAAAVVVVHLYGIPVPMDAVRDAATRAGALLIDDAAQGTGGSWRGRPLGSHGDFGVLSFGRGKGETGGGGGALLLREPGLLGHSLRAQVREAEPSHLGFALRLGAQWVLGRPELFGVPAAIPALRLGETIYKDPRPERAMSSQCARVLSETRAHSASEFATRRGNAERLGRTAGAYAIRPADVDSQPGWLRFPVLLPTAQVSTRFGALGVARAYPKPLDQLAPLRPLIASRRQHRGAETLAQSLRTLPTHSRLSAADLLRLEDWLRTELEGQSRLLSTIP
jgi:perosamine synthetase